MIGSFGDVVFVAGPTAIRTFTDFTRSSSGRWAKHEILGQKPKSQRIGPGLDSITFSMWFDARYGLDPRKELDALVAMERDGVAASLTIGGKGLGVDLWVITSLEQSWEQVDGQGNILFATANLTLEEYMQ
jgi:phage protein U